MMQTKKKLSEGKDGQAQSTMDLEIKYFSCGILEWQEYLD